MKTTESGKPDLELYKASAEYREGDVYPTTIHPMNVVE